MYEYKDNDQLPDHSGRQKTFLSIHNKVRQAYDVELGIKAIQGINYEIMVIFDEMGK